MKMCVAIMVKNEGKIIERCLSSIIPIADSVIITDTGSTDDTIIKAGLLLQNNNIPYKIYIRDFVNFGHNRTLLLDLAKSEKTDYVFMIDADEVLEYKDGNNIKRFKNSLNKDYYFIKMLAGNISYFLPRLTSNRNQYQYIGVTHEYLNCSGDAGEAPDLNIKQINDSSRRLANEKFLDDARLLKSALNQETDNELKARYTFYLAQTYQSLGNLKEASEYYNKRTDMEGWDEEIFYSYYQLGKIEEIKNSNACALFYLKAFDVKPSRVESLCALRDYWQSKGKSNLAKLIQNTIITIPKPSSGLFVEESKYENPSSIPIVNER